jgi:uncharacterized lipoprotein YehR (DUF1307 family)
MKKTLKSVIALLIAMASIISLVSCDLFGESETLGITEAPQSGETTPSETLSNEVPAEGLWKDAIYRTDKTFGSGSKTVQVEVKVSEMSITFTIKTDKATLGEALMEHSLVDGEQGAYGLYVKKVNGITADYDIDRSYWGFYKNGQYMMTGIDATDISDGEHYELVREG